MIFESKKEQDELVDDVEKSMVTLGRKNKSKNENPDHDEGTIGGEIPFDKIVPPSYGHSDSARDMNTSSRNTPRNDGDFIESLEARLMAILEDEVSGQAQAAATGDFRIGGPAVDEVEVLGRTKGTEPSTTRSKAKRKANNDMASPGKQMVGDIDKLQQQDGKESKEKKEVKSSETQPPVRSPQGPQGLAQTQVQESRRGRRRRKRKRR